MSASKHFVVALALQSTQKVSQTPGALLTVVLAVAQEELVEERGVGQREGRVREEVAIDLSVEGVCRAHHDAQRL